MGITWLLRLWPCMSRSWAPVFLPLYLWQFDRLTFMKMHADFSLAQNVDGRASEVASMSVSITLTISKGSMPVRVIAVPVIPALTPMLRIVARTLLPLLGDFNFGWRAGYVEVGSIVTLMLGDIRIRFPP